MPSLLSHVFKTYQIAEAGTCWEGVVVCVLFEVSEGSLVCVRCVLCGFSSESRNPAEEKREKKINPIQRGMVQVQHKENDYYQLLLLL